MKKVLDSLILSLYGFYIKKSLTCADELHEQIDAMVFGINEATYRYR